MGDTDKQRAERLIALAENAVQDWIIRYDKERRGYYLNVRRFKSPARLVRAFEDVATPV